MNHLILDEIATPGDHLHFARLELIAASAENIHTADFHELFWVELGRGIHWLNGKERELRPGDLCFVRPDDAHCVYAQAGGQIQFINVAFPSREWERTLATYGSTNSALFGKSESARTVHLRPAELAALSHLGNLIESAPRDQAALDLLLLGVIHVVQLHGKPEITASSMPDWLAGACRRIREPKHLIEGLPALVRLADRSADHVARVTRQCIGLTPTEVVNEARLEYAARNLATTANSIPTIAEASGFANLSHFYDLFSRRYGLPPAAYRRRALRIAGQADSPAPLDR